MPPQGPVEVNAPDKTDTGDVVLAEGRGTIKGTIKDGNGIPLEGIRVNVYEFGKTDLAGSDFTDRARDYSISLSLGQYRIATRSEGASMVFIDKFFDNVLTWGEADPIDISSAGDTRTVDFTLDTVVRFISGTVRDVADSSQLAGADVGVFIIRNGSPVWMASSL